MQTVHEFGKKQPVAAITAAGRLESADGRLFWIESFQIRAEPRSLVSVDLRLIIANPDFLRSLLALAYESDWEVEELIADEIGSRSVRMKFRPCCPWCGVPFSPRQSSGNCEKCGGSLRQDDVH